MPWPCFGSGDAPACSGDVHAVCDEVAAGAFNDPGRDRPAGGEGGGVVQVSGLVDQVFGAFIGPGAAPDAGGDLDGMALQDGQYPLAYPRFGGGIAFGEEAPRRAPDVFNDVDQVDDDGNDDPSGARFGLDAVDLVVVAVDQRDPAAPMVRVASFGFVEDAGDDLCGVVD